MIKDSGDRTLFESGAVRDLRVGKGRCDLLPLDVVGAYIHDDNEHLDMVLCHILNFQESGTHYWLFSALNSFAEKREWDMHTMFLEVAIQFEEGAAKYGDSNWQKGIPVRCYIDSAVRHYLKWCRGDEDEPHDRAFCWNILCGIWTCIHKPELNDYKKKDAEEVDGTTTDETIEETRQTGTCMYCGSEVPGNDTVCQRCWSYRNNVE